MLDVYLTTVNIYIVPCLLEQWWREAASSYNFFLEQHCEKYPECNPSASIKFNFFFCRAMPSGSQTACGLLLRFCYTPSECKLCVEKHKQLFAKLYGGKLYICMHVRWNFKCSHLNIIQNAVFHYNVSYLPMYCLHLEQ